jgi:hypothetical protein
MAISNLFSVTPTFSTCTIFLIFTFESFIGFETKGFFHTGLRYGQEKFRHSALLILLECCTINNNSLTTERFVDALKTLSCQAKQSIPHTTVTFHGNCVKMCEDFVPNLGDKTTGCCITTTHQLTLHFSPGNSWTKTTQFSSPTHPIFLFPRLKVKLKGFHFDTIEVNEAESQSLLNTHRTSRMHLMNCRSAENSAYVRKGHLKGDCGQ